MKITGNEPAQPFYVDPEIHDYDEAGIKPGITIRQQFAMAAMQGILTTLEGFTEIGDALSKTIASESCLCADALIAELNRTEDNK